ncbi:protein FAR1-RELATED SEQUENCE 5-like [Lactuca sativa]|uniref:protein FAR1-RELATED SEQUENCE 5-like n=1 Tax=Lactuca sativa TaxID=4236 RepID=UPI000CD84E31|nr:protein FAR1-RELATED SEQUENCE 5-like [Lactuca sativa]
MYSEYAEIGGFDVRLSTQSRFDNKIVKKKHVICNHDGNQKKKSCDTLGTSGVKRKRNSNSRVIGCQAKIIFESVYETPDYKVFQFHEFHNHPLEKRTDLKRVRRMSYSETESIVRALTSKIGPTMAHKLRASLRGGYEFVKPKVVDYKNLSRDINRVIGYKDAQMIVNTMNDHRTHYPNYSFEFNCQDDVLDCMFWADEMEKTYYAEFGDVILFDATFRTNKYRMVFVPFIAIDHHKKSVTAGAGLLIHESIESYSWLLKAFLKTHEKEPTLVLTDQDATIKQAIENVFPNSKHRLCIWHIMKKLKNKISDDLFMNIDFRKRFSKLVWDINMKPNVFETMSRSESMNSFLSTYLESGNLLLNFMTNYDTAIQMQRNTQRELDKMGGKFILCNTTTLKANLRFEHAFTIMMRCGVKEIPERYILKRWRKDVISRNYRFNSLQSDSGDYENVKLFNDSYYNEIDSRAGDTTLEPQPYKEHARKTRSRVPRLSYKTTYTRRSLNWMIPDLLTVLLTSKKC